MDVGALMKESCEIKVAGMHTKELKEFKPLLVRLPLHYKLVDAGDDSLLKEIEAELQALTKGWGDIDCFRAVQFLIKANILLKELDWFAEKSGGYRCHSYLNLCTAYTEMGLLDEAQERGDKISLLDGEGVRILSYLKAI